MCIALRALVVSLWYTSVPGVCGSNLKWWFDKDNDRIVTFCPQLKPLIESTYNASKLSYPPLPLHMAPWPRILRTVYPPTRSTVQRLIDAKEKACGPPRKRARSHQERTPAPPRPQEGNGYFHPPLPAAEYANATVVGLPHTLPGGQTHAFLIDTQKCKGGTHYFEGYMASDAARVPVWVNDLMNGLMLVHFRPVEAGAYQLNVRELRPYPKAVEANQTRSPPPDGYRFPEVPEVR